MFKLESDAYQYVSLFQEHNVRAVIFGYLNVGQVKIESAMILNRPQINAMAL